MFNTQKTLHRCLTRTLSTSLIKRSNHPPSLSKLKKKQADYQCEDGRPVWLKGGFCDKVLYGTTIILCYAGVISVFGLIYDHAKPASWKNTTC